MLPASNKGVGMNIGFPDVCLTPAGPAVAPIPYPNMAMNAQAAPFCVIVKVSMINALNLASAIPMTMGDEPGVAHPFFKQRGAYTMGNPIVFIEKLPGINLTCPTTGNMMNNALGAVLVPSVTNVFFTFATGASEQLAQRDLEAAAAVVSGGERAVEARMVDERTGLLRIRAFSADVPALSHHAMQRMRALGLRELVIDVRDNPGGDLGAFIELAGDFLEKGSEIVTVVDADGDRSTYRARSEEPHRLPVAILVNGRTASAAELFAGALQAHGRAVIVGERTFGKPFAHRIVCGVGGAATRATAATCLLPLIGDITGRGLSADITIAAPTILDARVTGAISAVLRDT